MEQFHPILDGVKFVVQNSKSVKINFDKLREFTRHNRHEFCRDVIWDSNIHFNDGTWKTANYLFVLDALNFCFWSEDGAKWGIEYNNRYYEGYNALAASLTRAIEEGIPIYDFEFMKNATKEDLARIFRKSAERRNEIPLLNARLAILNAIGNVLCREFYGRFNIFINMHSADALSLAFEIATLLPFFTDVVYYKDRRVSFYKRAQILVADLYTAFGGKDVGNFENMNRLTAFADYKLPQILRHCGILEYNDELAAKVDSLVLIPLLSEEEVEIRAHTVWAVELIRDELQKIGIRVNAYEIDYLLWVLAKKTQNMRPHHRTKTIYY